MAFWRSERDFPDGTVVVCRNFNGVPTVRIDMSKSDQCSFESINRALSSASQAMFDFKERSRKALVEFVFDTPAIETRSKVTGCITCLNRKNVLSTSWDGDFWSESGSNWVLQGVITFPPPLFL